VVMHPIGLVFGLGFISILVVAAGVVLLVGWAVSQRALSPTSPPPVQPASHETPLDILARRFAAGEITSEEYERGRDLLSGGGSKPG
jgi:uncharacterized membrane protein